jgi:type I restriction enzyme S subunit
LKRIALGKLASINRGLSWSLDQESSEPVSGSSPVLRIGNVQNKLDTSDLVYISKVSVEQKEKHKVGENSIVMVGSNGNHNRIGNCCIIKSQSDFLYASFLIGLVPYKDKIDSDFLYYVISSPHTQREITDSVTGSTGLANLSLSFLRELPIGIPDTSTSQTQIAAVLSCIDRAIEHTEALIAKQQRIKTGLMQDLLTKGIDEHGDIRSEATHEFKDSPLGRIPKEWKTKQFMQVYKRIKRGPSLSANPYGKGIRYLTSDNLNNDGTVNWEVRKHLDVSIESLRSLLEPQDVILNCVNSEEQIGRACFINSLPEPTTVGFNNFAISFNTNLLFPKFGYYQISYWNFQKQLSQKIKPAINQASFSSTDILDILLNCPSTDEQSQIAHQLDVIADKIRTEQILSIKLQKIKQGLMQDLLTGKVSVSGLLVESAAGIA